MRLKSKNIVKILISSLIIPLIFGFFFQMARASSGTTGNKTIIHFWHAMSGQRFQALKKVINDYNQSQDKYFVIPDYQGSYEDTLAKYLSVSGTTSSPDIVQVIEAGTQTMRDAKAYKPVQDFIDAEGYDKSQLEPRIANYYSLNGRQQSMPFNTSTMVMYVNKDLLKSVGIEKTPETFEEVSDFGKKLKEKGSKATAIGAQSYSWVYEQLVANQNAISLNKSNGQEGTPDEALTNNQSAVDYLNWKQKSIEEGAATNFGTDESTMVASFIKGDIGLMLATSAYSAQLFKAVNYELGIIAIPHPEDKSPVGTQIGGANLHVGVNRPKAKENGAWDFLKYMASPKAQADWSVGTGYYSINKKAYDEPVIKKSYSEHPQLIDALKQLRDAKDVPANSGIFSTKYLYMRQQLETAESAIFNGADVKESLDKATNDISRELKLAERAKEK
ncbi:ABC transporter substrate-binding protein [Lactococcus termiticola]|uniref:Glycerol-3-phosphate ABC transporter substrate-binding protein n=1 Tax=Lactococcus termiticola TaxID=2169526 RepID=A0A2R5HKM7_9LACT|nr:ABC transporter substrate-binding protein [Lactococcus termiticola]GBG97438.1 glycerol-3-phosphate ABC transporter substrate-binding protein [Lactococcus termiticola]